MNTVVARGVEIVPLQLHLTLSAVEWQEFEVPPSPQSCGKLWAPVHSHISRAIGSGPPLPSSNGVSRRRGHCPLDGSDYLGEVIQGVTFKNGIKHIQDAA